MRFIFKVQSISDVVTNSSSEMFAFRGPGLIKNEIWELIKKHHEKHDWFSQFNANPKPYNLYKFYEYFLDKNKEDVDSLESWNVWEKMTREEQDLWDDCSGMGGILEFFDSHDRYRSTMIKGYLWKGEQDNPEHPYSNSEMSYEKYLKEIDIPEYGGEDYFVLDVDQGFNSTINMIKDFFVDVKRLD